MRKKHYDDDLLIRLLADPALTRGQIAQRVGISRRMLHSIATGVYRKDLRPRIREAERARARKQPDTATGEVVRQADAYDDDEMVELLARGDLSTAEIARHFGISRDMVWRIATGRRRPDLHRRVKQLVVDVHSRVRRQAVMGLAGLIEQHIEVGLNGSGEIARKCREFVLDRFLDSTPGPRPPAPPVFPSS